MDILAAFSRREAREIEWCLKALCSPPCAILQQGL